MRIRFLNLKPSRFERRELENAAKRVIASGKYILGEEVAGFQREFSQYIGDGRIGSNYGTVGVGNGFDALAISLRALGVGEGQEVIVPVNAPLPVWMAVSSIGAIPKPVLPEVFNGTYNVSGAEISGYISHGTKAIILVHMYGLPVRDTAEIVLEANDLGIHVIEDCSHAHGAFFGLDVYNKKVMCGTKGTCAAFSFYPTKNLGALGDGGAIVSNRESFLRKSYSIREYGEGKIVGVNSRLDEMQAAFLRVRLPKLNSNNDARNRVAKIYEDILIDCPGIRLPKNHVPGRVWHQYVIMLPEGTRNRLAKYLKLDKGIDTMVHYPTSPINMMVYENINKRVDSYWRDGIRELSENVLSLPIGSVGVVGAYYVAVAIKRFLCES